MIDLIRFEDVSEIVGLDAWGERLNRLFLSAVSEEICLFLGRNLFGGTATERIYT